MKSKLIKDLKSQIKSYKIELPLHRRDFNVPIAHYKCDDLVPLILHFDILFNRIIINPI